MSKKETWREQALSKLQGDSISTARKGLARINDPELANALVRTGLGNHHAVIEAIAQVERDLAEDDGTQPTSESSAVNMFPNSDMN